MTTIVKKRSKAMQHKYKNYTNSYMKYLRFLHKEYKKPEFKKILHRGYFGFWKHSDWDYARTKREGRLLGHYFDHLLGVNILGYEHSGTH